MKPTMANVKDIEKEITKLIEKLQRENPAILGINIGTHGGTLIASKFKKETKLTKVEISSATSSLAFLSSKILKGAINQNIMYNLIMGKTSTLITFLTENITLIAYLNRELSELEGLERYTEMLKKFTLQVSAIIETSEIMKEELFVAIKRAIPDALVLAVITKDGLPIKIQSAMPESMISAMISAIFNISDVLVEGNLEFSIITGEVGSLIIHEIDKNRILCIAVSQSDERKLGAYIAKIKSVIK